MRNFIILDYSKQNCHGVVNSAGKCNTVILSLIPATTQLTNYQLELTDVKAKVHKLELSNTMTVDIDESYFNVSGTIRFRLLSAEGNSEYVNLNCIEFEAGEDVRCAYKNGSFNMCKCIAANTDSLPIATTTSLGTVIVGNNLSVDENGVLTAIVPDAYEHPIIDTGEELDNTNLLYGSEFEVIDALEFDNGHVKTVSKTTFKLPDLPSDATTSESGLLSANDKAKLDAFKDASEYVTKEEYETPVSVSWENIKNKPFYENENGDTLEWDGDTGGLEKTGSYYKVSDATPTASELDNGFTLMGYLNGNTTVEKDLTELIKKEQPKGYHQYNADILAMGLYVVIAYNDCTWLGNAYTKGTYFMYMPDSTLVTKLAITGYSGFAIKQLDSKFVDAYTKGETASLIEDAKNEVNETITDARNDLHLEIVVAENELNANIDAAKTEVYDTIDALELGVKSWNELEDRPFGEVPTGSDTLTWNGDTTDLLCVELQSNIHFYHIADTVFVTKDYIKGYTVTRLYNGEIITDESTVFSVNNGILINGAYSIVCVSYDNQIYNVGTASAVTFPKKGTYFRCDEGNITTALTINEYTGFPSVKPIDTKYLPKATVNDLGAVIVGDNLVVDVNGKVHAVVDMYESITNSELENLLK